MKVAFIGLGKMGSGMAGDLIKAGHKLTVYNRTRSGAEMLQPLGATVAESPGEAASDAEALITMLADDHAVGEVIFAPGNAIESLRAGAVHISMSTISVACKGLSANSVYSATKAAIRSFARTWTTDLKNRRIRVNAVSPGTIDTPGLNDLLASSEAGQQRLKMISNVIPLGRLGTPGEIAKAVVFLASDDSSYITGTELFVDGGMAQV